MSAFVFVVSSSGACWLASRRSGRRLSGGAVTACCRAVARSVRVLVSVRGRVLSLSYRRPVVPAFRGGRFSVSAAPVASPPSASSAGSRLFLSSSTFGAACLRGCPLRFLLSVFRWPVRSAVVLALCRVFLSAPVALSRLPRSVRVRFLRVALSALGFSVAGRCTPSHAVSWLLPRSLAPASVPVFSGVASVGGLSEGLSALSRCLAWLSARAPLGRGCPPAVAPALALLAALVASSLA